MYIAKIISFVLALVAFFAAACSVSVGQAIILAAVGVVLFVVAFALEQLDEADWQAKTKYCKRKSRLSCWRTIGSKRKINSLSHPYCIGRKRECQWK